MTLRYLSMVVVSLACLGCGSEKPTAPPRVHRVSLAELVRAYRSSPSERRYDGITVQVYVPADATRRFRPDHVEAFKILESRLGCVQFRTDTALLDSEADLVVTGVCRGQVHDGVQRSGGIDWYLLVEECRVTQVKR